MTDAKDALLDDVQRNIHHHPKLSSAGLDVRDGDGPREIVFELVDCGKYTLRDEFLGSFETGYGGHQFELVIEAFYQDHVSAVLVDTSVFERTVDAFLSERATISKSLESYNALTLRHVEALEEWGAVGRLSELDAKHIHDAFLDYRPLLREEGKAGDLLLRQLTA